MKILIVYYSFTENNKKLAYYLQDELECDIAEINTVKSRTGLSIFMDLIFNRQPEIKTVPFNLHDYDHILFISPIWAGKIAMPLASFLFNQRRDLSAFSFITVCGGGNEMQKEKVRDELLLLTGKQPCKVQELWVSGVLSHGRKLSTRASSYRLTAGDLQKFNLTIADFLKDIR